MRVIKVKNWRGIPNNYTGIVEWPDGSKYWILNGKHHREDGPAYESADGSKTWYLNGERHRVDGPAVEWANSSKDWYLNDNFLFRLPLESQPFILLEEIVDEEGKEQIKILNQKEPRYGRTFLG